MKTINYLFVFALIFTFACGSGASNQETASEETVAEETVMEEVAEPAKDIVALAAETEFLSTLVAAVTAGDLVSALQAEGPFTVFAPTNDAFAALPEGTLEMLLKPENKDKLVEILTYHVVAGKVMSTDLVDGMQAETLSGAMVTISLANGAQVNSANVTAADIEASNGVVHVIDAVLLPPTN